MNSLIGKVAIITGASRGIGAATAVELAKHGVSVLIHGRDAESLEEVAHKCKEANTFDTNKRKVAMVLGDLEKEETTTDIVATAKQTYKSIDILFNNAAYKHPHDDVIHMGGTVEALDCMYRVNIRATYLLVQNLIPQLEKTKGTVINCSTTATSFILPRLTGYCTQKAAMDHLTKLLALSLANKGIRVNSVNPGYCRTDILTRVVGDEISNYWYKQMANCTPLGKKLVTPEEVAGVVSFLASDIASGITGQLINVDRGAVITNPMVEWQQHA